ncbi:MAG: SH3 domain-containing protein [Clostridiales bacterium]|nr:SH3 domain-containing protein [Roseburia sp.]MDD7638098.1 SH3 domain-containing protein [Clostridiales bacterium]MDY4111579.1 SH3 domain-containing protein [Roseburia sp.]
MDNSKLKDKIKQMKIDKVVEFVKEHIRYFAAGALFVVMVIVLATCAGPNVKKNNSSVEGTATVEEYQVDAYEEVNTLIAQYYTAYAAGDITTLTALATPISANEQSYIAMFSQYVDEYQNIKCYTKSGLDANSYLVSVSMEIKFTGVDTPAPGLDFFYIRTNEQGSLYIDNLYCQYNLANQENALDTSIQNLINGFENQEDVIALQSEVQTRYDAAVNADTNLSTMIYTTIPNAITNWVSQIAAQNTPAEGTEAVLPEGTETAEEPVGESMEEAQEELTAEEPETVYTVDKVNVRREADTSSEKLATLEKGTAIGRTGTEGEWSRVDYGGIPGYIKSEYLTTEAPQTTDTDAREEGTAGGSIAEGTVITLQNTVNIRSGMSETSDRIGTAYAGEKVKVVMSYAEGWTKVTWNNKTGYIKSSLLQ